MSKKIDIDQLIENKYSTTQTGEKSSFLTLESLMKEIDTVLENIAGSGAEQVYGRKAGLPDNLPEGDEYVNVAQDNPALVSGHGVERASNSGHSEGGSIDKPIITNPLPEEKREEFLQEKTPFQSWKDKPASGKIKMELELLYPALKIGRAHV